MPKKSRGFTLIELLIVISIIAILMIIGIVTYEKFLKNGRDTKRQTDLRLIQSALERYHSSNVNYPASLNSLTPSYLSTLPADPIAGNSYLYKAFKSDRSSTCDNLSPTTQCTRYCVYAGLENQQSNLNGCPFQASNYNFAVTSPD